MAYYRSRAGDEAVGHSMLGLLMAALGVALGLAIALSLGVELPDPRQVVHSLGIERSLGLKGSDGRGSSEPGPPVGRAVGGPLDDAKGEDRADAACTPEEPTFAQRFADLKQRLGPEMGDALECEQTNPENGDVLQRTTSGLAYYRKATETPSFTDGWRHWALTGDGLLYWEGDSADPPPTAERLGR